jgi:hypothetical protein
MFMILSLLLALSVGTAHYDYKYDEGEESHHTHHDDEIIEVDDD